METMWPRRWKGRNFDLRMAPRTVYNLVSIRVEKFRPAFWGLIQIGFVPVAESRPVSVRVAPEQRAVVSSTTKRPHRVGSITLLAAPRSEPFNGGHSCRRRDISQPSSRGSNGVPCSPTPFAVALLARAARRGGDVGQSAPVRDRKT